MFGITAVVFWVSSMFGISWHEFPMCSFFLAKLFSLLKKCLLILRHCCSVAFHCHVFQICFGVFFLTCSTLQHRFAFFFFFLFASCYHIFFLFSPIFLAVLVLSLFGLLCHISSALCVFAVSMCCVWFLCLLPSMFLHDLDMLCTF